MIKLSKATRALLLALLATSWLGCGDDEMKSALSRQDFPARHSALEDARRGGTLTVLAAGDVDSLDPGVANYQFTYMITFATQRTLMGWPPEPRRKPQPDLAERARVSDRGRRLTFRIKRGVRFSPPVDRVIRAADFKYAIERGLLPGIANGYVETYLGALEGFKEAEAEAADATEAPDISGIRAPAPDKLVLRFTQPVAATALQALSLPIGAPVPEEYARHFDRDSPSSYAQHLVATGPYMVESDDSGEVTGYEPGHEIKLVRNPNWDPATDYRPAFLDSIVIREGFTDPGAASRKILNDDSLINGDFPPSPEVLKEAATRHPEQLMLAPLGVYRYIALNTTIAPLDDVNVRRAIAAAIDRQELRLALGGPLVGPIATHFLPPGIPGFRQAGGYQGPDLDFLAVPSGDPELAARYLRRAGYETGEVTGAEPLLMVGDSSGPGRQVAELVKETLEELGFDIELRLVSRDTMIVRFCNLPKAEVAVCPNGGWIKDFNDPQPLLDASFSGDAIQTTNNPNWSQLDDTRVNRAMARARVLVDPDARARAWAQIDRRVMALAPAIPWSWDYFPAIRSADVVPVINAFTGNSDLSFTSLEAP